MQLQDEDDGIATDFDFSEAFDQDPDEIKPIPVKKTRNAPQSAVYVRREDLEGATHLEDALKT